MSFLALGLSPYLHEVLVEENYQQPYPIQQEAIPAIIAGKDVLGIAKTGSGKTASYVLPILTNMQDPPKLKNRHVNVLVLVPTRELAVQVGDVFRLFISVIPGRLKSLAVYGGVSINIQMQALQGVNILIATPGRLLDLVESNAVHLSSVSTLVLDEADKMLNMGFKDEMDRILSLLPKRRQNLLFSATLSKAIDDITAIILRNPQVIQIEEKPEDHSLINQMAYWVSHEKKGPLLRYLIKSQNMQQVLVFTSSIIKADRVAAKLIKNGIQAASIHGKKSQHARTTVLRDFKAGKLKVMVATDLLARGIDIEFLPYVINYELPRSPKDFVHRIGRTGRAENPGEAISLVAPDEIKHFKVILKKMKAWVEKVDADELNLHGY
jgi:ATP-dependent RNA helicase RhlE